MKHRNCPCVVMIAGIDHDYRCALKWFTGCMFEELACRRWSRVDRLTDVGDEERMIGD